MKIKLDENLSRYLKDPLLQLGHDVSTALEEGLLGKVDSEVGAAAKSEWKVTGSGITLTTIFSNPQRREVFPIGQRRS